MVSSTPRPHFTPGKDPVPILQEAGWAPGPVWTGGKSRPHRDSIPDRPARSSVAIPTELQGPHTRGHTVGIMSNTLGHAFEIIYYTRCYTVGIMQNTRGHAVGMKFYTRVCTDGIIF